MPVPPPMLSRRTLLTAAALGTLSGGLAGCTAASDGGSVPLPPTADEQARLTAAEQEAALAERARLTAQRHPTLTVAAVASLAHQAHVDALQETLSQTKSPEVPGSSPAPPPAQVSRDRRSAARALAEAQAKAATAHREALAEAAVTGGLARLLASVAASDDGFARAVNDEGDA